MKQPTFLEVKKMVETDNFKYDIWDPEIQNAGTAQGNINNSV